MTIVTLQPHDTAAFIKLPWHLYKRDHHWVPPLIAERKAFLNPRKNPFFQHAQVQLFLAQEHGKTVGRIAAVINAAHDRFHNERAGFFGLFECAHDGAAAAAALLAAAEAWVRERGATFLRGPVNLSTNELDCGLLVSGFGAAPVFQSAYNPPYYANFIEACGYAKCKDLLAFYRNYYPVPTGRVVQVVQRLQERRKLTVRTIDMRHFDEEVLRITDIYNDAWSDNWGFVPITAAEAHHMAAALKLAIIPALTFFVEREGEAVGCFVTLPDLNQIFRHMHGRLTPWGLLRFFYQRHRTDTVRVTLMGVRKRYRRLGIDALMYVESWKQAPRVGVVHSELAWLLEDNALMIRGMEELGAIPYKRYRLYQKDFA